MKKNGLFANLKKCYFQKDKVRLLGYVVLALGVRIEDEKIEVVKNWPEAKFVRDIQVFLSFANFYCYFIQGFSRIAALLTSILRISLTLTLATQKSINLVDKFGGSDRGKNKARKASASTKGPIGADYSSFNHVSNAVSNIVSNSTKNISNYLTPDTKKTFDQLCQAFTKVAIFQHINLE